VGGQVLISKEALEHTLSPLEVSGKQDIQAKGLRHPMTVYEVAGMRGEMPRSLPKEHNDILRPIEEWVMFNMYPIEGKMIQDTSVSGRLIEFSPKRAVVLIGEEDEVTLNPQMDVEIFAAGETGKALLTEIYAKITHREGQRITLHFTHINHSFQKFLERVRKQESEGQDEQG
jgi:hypothetical protein